MSLFSTKDLEVKEEPILRAAATDDDSTESFVQVKCQADIDLITGRIKDFNTVHYCTGGAFSAHELLFSILRMTGPAKVYISTWTMTEYPARLLSEALSSGKITELYCLLDVRMEKNPSVHQLIQHNSTMIRLSQCHAKVMIIENDGLSISIISSQNMTENPRIEAGVISTNRSVMLFHRGWILKEIENGNAFE